jgi:hypothetical protein
VGIFFDGRWGREELCLWQVRSVRRRRAATTTDLGYTPDLVKKWGEPCPLLGQVFVAETRGLCWFGKNNWMILPVLPINKRPTITLERWTIRAKRFGDFCWHKRENLSRQRGSA